MLWRPSGTSEKKFSPCPKAAVEFVQQFLQVLLSAIQSIRITSGFFQPVQVLQQYLIVTNIQCPKSPKWGLECGESMLVVLLFVDNAFYAGGMLLTLYSKPSWFPSLRTYLQGGKGSEHYELSIFFR